jgi:single-stranded-DNA-specific exonuclease
VDTTWKVRDIDDATVGRLAGALGLRHVTARCLAARGITDPDEAKSYLAPKLGYLRKPDGLAGFQHASARLAQAVQARERIGVFGDYDVDGVTTTALLTGFLRALGASVVPRVARRAAGYGFGCGDADYFVSAGCTLIITGDCGTSDIDAIERANARDAQVIVVDHHTVPERAGEHPAFALINPFRADSTFPFRNMASVGLSFYLMASLRTELKRAGYFTTGPGNRLREPDPRQFLDLVALGTIADMVPLKGENRILTSTGLTQLALRRRPGLSALLRIAGVDLDRPIDERVIGWKLAPRLNAPGRMGDAEPALALLLATDQPAAERAAERLEQANDQRRVAQEQVLEEALEMLRAREPGSAIVVAKQGWQSGVVGIVAAKLVEMYHRPAFVIALNEGTGRGSARTPKGPVSINLYQALAACGEHLQRFGGHAGAAGLTVDAGRVDELEQALCQAVSAQTDAEPSERTADVDAEVGLGDVDERLCRELESLAPFGQGNEKPLLVCRGLHVRESRRVGDGSHLKLEVEDRHGVSRSGIAFGQGDSDPGRGATIDAAFAPTVSEWRGRVRVELEIRELAPERPIAPEPVRC